MRKKAASDEDQSEAHTSITRRTGGNDSRVGPRSRETRPLRAGTTPCNDGHEALSLKWFPQESAKARPGSPKFSNIAPNRDADAKYLHSMLGLGEWGRLGRRTGQRTAPFPSLLPPVSPSDIFLTGKKTTKLGLEPIPPVIESNLGPYTTLPHKILIGNAAEHERAVTVIQVNLNVAA